MLDVGRLGRSEGGEGAFFAGKPLSGQPVMFYNCPLPTARQRQQGENLEGVKRVVAFNGMTNCFRSKGLAAAAIVGRRAVLRLDLLRA